MTTVISLWPAYVARAAKTGASCWLKTDALSAWLQNAKTLTIHCHHEPIDLPEQHRLSRIILLAQQHSIRFDRSGQGYKLEFDNSGYRVDVVHSAPFSDPLLKAVLQERQLNRLALAQQSELPHYRHRFYGALTVNELEGLLRCVSGIHKIQWGATGAVTTDPQANYVLHLATRDPYILHADTLAHQITLQWRHLPDVLLVLQLPEFMQKSEIEAVAAILQAENKANRYWLAEQVEGSRVPPADSGDTVVQLIKR